MFRESDYEAPALHPTYYDRQIPSFQQVAQNAKFERHTMKVKENAVDFPPKIPATQDCFYDPSHRRADWTGMVAKEAEKRHVDGRMHKSTLAPSDAGFIGAEDTVTIRSRRAYATVSDPSLIGGIASNQAWKSENQRLFDKVPTEKDQLASLSRAASRRLSSSHQIIPPNEVPVVTRATRASQPVQIGNNRSMLANIGSALLNQIPP